MICSDINFGIKTTSDISKLLYVTSGIYAKYHVQKNAIICLYYYQQKVCNYHM